MTKRKLKLKPASDPMAPTPERVARASGAVEVSETMRAGVRRVRMLDTASDDRGRMQAVRKVSRPCAWAAETLRRVYLLSVERRRVVASYGAARHPTRPEVEDASAYAETLVARCRRDAVRHWEPLRAALIADHWTITRGLPFALRWLAAWLRRAESEGGDAWDVLAEVLSLEGPPERDDGGVYVETPSDMHLWLAMALTTEGLPASEVPRFADEVGAEWAVVANQLQVWRREGLVRLAGGGDKPVVWRLG